MKRQGGGAQRRGQAPPTRGRGAEGDARAGVPERAHPPAGQRRERPRHTSAESRSEARPARPAAHGLNTREVAAQVLGLILDKRQSLKRELHRAQERIARSEDKALLREMVAGVVRHLPHIDWALDEVIARGLVETQRELAQILRVGAYQILFLERVPSYAAVDQCVRAAKAVSAAAGGFVNGILRSLVERREGLLEAPYVFGGVEGLSMRLGMPPWMVERYVDRFGEGTGEAILSAYQDPAPTALLFPSRAAEAQATILLRQEGFVVRSDADLPLTASVERGDPSSSEAFARGLFYIMDPASQAPAALLPLSGGERVLDLCAAPGGKTLVISGRLQKGGWVLATDVNARRLGQVRENVARLGRKNVRFARVDASTGLPFGPVWPVVVLDAPCSSLGTLRRNPEIRWQITASDLLSRAERQKAMLEAAAAAVAPGGVLSYSVCSIEPEETTAVVAWFLERHPDFRAEPMRPPEQWKPLLKMEGPAQAYLLPDVRPWDAFFVALMRRAGGRAPMTRRRVSQ